MTLSGCLSTEAALIEAAAKKAQAETRTSVPPLPEECRKHMDRVYPQVGEKARWTQKRWEKAADQRDLLTDDCAAHYDSVKAGLEGKGSAK